MERKLKCILKQLELSKRMYIYMDDICFSVKTTNHAVNLTKEIDEVLAEGGFQVRGWSSNEELTDEHHQESDGK